MNLQKIKDKKLSRNNMINIIQLLINNFNVFNENTDDKFFIDYVPVLFPFINTENLNFIDLKNFSKEELLKMMKNGLVLHIKMVNDIENNPTLPLMLDDEQILRIIKGSYKNEIKSSTIN